MVPAPLMAPYCASKSGVEAFAQPARGGRPARRESRRGLPLLDRHRHGPRRRRAPGHARGARSGMPFTACSARPTPGRARRSGAIVRRHPGAPLRARLRAALAATYAAGQGNRPADRRKVCRSRHARNRVTLAGVRLRYPPSGGGRCGRHHGDGDRDGDASMSAAGNDPAIIIIGSGFAAACMAIRLKQARLPRLSDPGEERRPRRNAAG